MISVKRLMFRRERFFEIVRRNHMWVNGIEAFRTVERNKPTFQIFSAVGPRAHAPSDRNKNYLFSPTRMLICSRNTHHC